MDAADIIGILGGIGGIAGAVYGFVANRKAARANELAEDANAISVDASKTAREANQLSGTANNLSGESNRIAVEANSVAREAIERQQRSDNLDHAANLIFTKNEAGMKRVDNDTGSSLVFAFTNIGAVDARDVLVRIKRMTGRREGQPRWITSGPKDIPPNESRSFAFSINEDFFTPYESGQLLEYWIRYKDRLGGHDKRYRVQLSGMWKTGWTGTALAGKLDGKPFTIFGVEGLAPGIAYEENESEFDPLAKGIGS